MSTTFGKIPHIAGKVRRNGFDLSHKQMFTAPLGMLLPIYCEEVVPSDHFKISVQSLTRTLPLNTAAFARVSEHFDFFFVPYRRLYSEFDDFVIGNNENVNFFRSLAYGTAGEDGKVVLSAPQLKNSAGVNVSTKAGQRPLLFSLKYLAQQTILSLYHFRENSNDTSFFSNGVDELGYALSYGARRLLDLLGYGNFRLPSNGEPSFFGAGEVPVTSTESLVNLFALQAYQKIYQDFYRNTYWQAEDFSLSTSKWYDYLTRTYTNESLPTDSKKGDVIPWLRKLLTIRYADYKKDMLMSIKPMQQLGDLTLIYNDTANTRNIASTANSVDMQHNSESPVNGDISDTFTSFNNGLFTSRAIDNATEVNQNKPSSIYLSLLDIRIAKCLQRWKAVSLTNRMDYKNQVKAHLGATVPDGRVDLAEYIGGHTNSLNISEVTNMGQNQGNISGKGTMYSNNDTITYDVKEHGIIMCIYHLVPEIDYSGYQLQRQHTKSHFMDYLQPEYQHLGLAPMYVRDFSTVNLEKTDDVISNPDDLVGYNTRYPEYKCRIDNAHGELTLGGSLQAWTIPSNLSKFINSFSPNRVQLDYGDLKIDPKIDSTIFKTAFNGKENTDHYYTNCYFNISAIRPLDADELPYQ